LKKTKHLPLKTSKALLKVDLINFGRSFDKKKYQSKRADENAVYNNAEITEKPEFEGGMELL
jgi:hypothetical protein